MKNGKFIFLFVCMGISAVAVQARTRQFVFGADISWVDADIDRGQKYYDGNEQKDIFTIFKDHKFNSIRLRLFVDPTAKVPGSSESPYSSQGYCNLEHTIEFAKKIKEAGMLFLLDFHYSDVWADPGKQFKPVSWEGLSFTELKEKVRTYTRESLEACEAAGVLPDMVQVGNEIVGGMIWPDGRSSNMSQFAALVNAGIDGVKDVSDDIDIVIHFISENSPTQWLSSLIKAGVKRIDVFALSYYSKWHGTPDDLKKRLSDAAGDHDIAIAIAEYADNHRVVNDIVFNLPDEKGFGTFVWEPTRWEQTLFTNGKTNGKIDFYPQMWKDFGNDTLPLKEGLVAVVPHCNSGNGYESGPFLADAAGMLYKGGTSQPWGYTILNLQGRTCAAVGGTGIAGAVPAIARNLFLILPTYSGKHRYTEKNIDMMR